MLRHIGIVTNHSERAGPALAALVEFLSGQPVEVVLGDAIRDEFVQGLDLPRLDTQAMGHKVDLVIVIGGDGTMLRAARQFAGLPVRMLGINLGRLGFLTDISPDTMADQLQGVLAGEFAEEVRFLLHARLIRNGATVEEAYAFNDIVVSKWNVARLIAFETFIDGTFVNRQRSDGIIIATPTGSTAYALSGGGPIMHPALNTVVLVPICPHTFSQRPIVVDANCCIEIVLDPEHHRNARLSSDGENLQEMEPGDRISVTKLADSITLIHPADHDPYATLRAKLGWGKEL